MTVEGRRMALVVAGSQFADPTLRQLITPGQDAADLARVLTDSMIGDFEVKVLIDQPAHQVQREIEAFFAGRQREVSAVSRKANLRHSPEEVDGSTPKL